MTNFEINGKTYGMCVNCGTLTYAEMINDGVKPHQQNRLNMGFALACFYGSDMNCGLKLEDVIGYCSTASKMKELMDAVNRETALFNDLNDQTAEPEGNANGATESAQ